MYKHRQKDIQLNIEVVSEITYIIIKQTDRHTNRKTENVLSQTEIQTEGTHLFISDVFESVGDDCDSHVDEVGGCDLEDLLRKLLAVLVDLLQTKEIVY